MKKLFISFIAVIFIGCALPIQILKTTSNQEKIYRPYQEIAFCLSPGGRIYNILYGGFMSVPMPFCQSKDIPVHSHSIFSENFANFLDIQTWKNYRKKFGHTKFGLMIRNKIKIYHIQ